MPGFDTLQPGFYAPPLGAHCQNANGVVVANRCYFVRTIAPKAMTITKIGFGVNVAATADDPVDVAIFDQTLATLLGSSGSRTGFLNSLGGKQVPLQAPVQVIGGVVYYAALAYGPVGGAAAQLAFYSPNLLTLQLFGTSIPLVEGRLVDNKFPITAGPGSGGPSTGPILALIQ